MPSCTYSRTSGSTRRVRCREAWTHARRERGFSAGTASVHNADRPLSSDDRGRRARTTTRSRSARHERGSYGRASSEPAASNSTKHLARRALTVRTPAGRTPPAPPTRPDRPHRAWVAQRRAPHAAPRSLDDRRRRPRSARDATLHIDHPGRCRPAVRPLRRTPPRTAHRAPRGPTPPAAPNAAAHRAPRTARTHAARCAERRRPPRAHAERRRAPRGPTPPAAPNAAAHRAPTPNAAAHRAPRGPTPPAAPNAAAHPGAPNAAAHHAARPRPPRPHADPRRRRRRCRRAVGPVGGRHPAGSRCTRFGQVAVACRSVVGFGRHGRRCSRSDRCGASGF
jgi:hypothetical protein